MFIIFSFCRFSKPIVNCLFHQIYLQKPNLLEIPQQELLTKESADRILQGEVSSVIAILFTYKAKFSLCGHGYNNETAKHALFP